MIHLEFDNIKAMEDIHVTSIMRYVMSKNEAVQLELYNNIRQLPEFAALPDVPEDWKWLEDFLLSSIETLQNWVTNHADKLKFTFFRKLYINRFANGAGIYVWDVSQYNAYKLFDMMDRKVCPYCDIEDMIILDKQTGRKYRAMEFDHYFPKGENEYPALAMCFYNLVPSGKICNETKHVDMIGANPYSADIESQTNFTLEYPQGTNLENLKPADCTIRLNAVGGMKVNDESMRLDQRYNIERVLSEAHRAVLNKQQHPDEMLEEMERSGYGTKEHWMKGLYGLPYSETKGKEHMSKMKWDLIRY